MLANLNQGVNISKCNSGDIAKNNHIEITCMTLNPNAYTFPLKSVCNIEGLNSVEL